VQKFKWGDVWKTSNVHSPNKREKSVSSLKLQLIISV